MKTRMLDYLEIGLVILCVASVLAIVWNSRRPDKTPSIPMHGRLPTPAEICPDGVIIRSEEIGKTRESQLKIMRRLLDELEANPQAPCVAVLWNSGKDFDSEPKEDRFGYKRKESRFFWKGHAEFGSACLTKENDFKFSIRRILNSKETNDSPLEQLITSNGCVP